MRIHTSLQRSQIRAALDHAIESGLVSRHVYFDRFTSHGTRSPHHPHAFEVHLATPIKLPGEKRYRPNSGATGYDTVAGLWAATYDEWGHFLNALFVADPTAKAGPYTGAYDFHHRTEDRYK